MFITSVGCNPPSTPGQDNNPAGNTPPPSSSTTPPKPPNLRTGLTPDPKTAKAEDLPYEKQEPAEKDNAGKLVGDFSDLDKIPLAYITFKNTPEWCSGILASDATAHSYIVVTAAHCFWDDNKRFYEPKDVFLVDKAGKWVKAETVFYVREDIDDAEYKDIALVRLKNKPAIDTHPPIPIGVRATSLDADAANTWESKALKVGTKVFSWGNTSKRWTERTVIAMTGAKIWGDAAGRDMRRWVIPTKNAPAFGGDSGGPLVMKINNNWHLVGVLQGFKPEELYTDEKTITFTWVDGFLQNIWDANGDEMSKGMSLPVKLDAAHLQNY